MDRKLEFTLTNDDLMCYFEVLAGMPAFGLHAKRGVRIFGIAVGIFIVLLGFAATRIGSTERQLAEELWVIVVIGLFGLFCVFVLPKLLDKRFNFLYAQQHARQLMRDGVEAHRAYHFVPEGIERETEVQYSRIKWASVKEIEVKGAHVIITHRAGVFVIPRRVFEGDDDVNRFARDVRSAADQASNEAG